MSKLQTTSNKLLLPPALLPDYSTNVGGLESEDISFRQLINVLRKRKYIVLATTVLCCLIGIGVSFLMTPSYKSVVAIDVQKAQSDGTDLGALASALTDFDDVKTEIQTAVSILQSDAVALETLEKMKYEEHYTKGAWTFSHPGGRIPSERDLPIRNAPVARQNLLTAFEKHLKVTPIDDTRVVEVAFSDPDPAFAAKTANALVEQYVQDNLARRNSATLEASHWMAGEIEDLEKQVQTAQQRLIDFEKQSGLIAIPAASGSGQPGGASSAGASAISSPVLNRLTQLNQDLVNAETTLVSREAIAKVAKAGDLDALSAMAMQMQSSDPAVAAQAPAFGEIGALREQKSALRVQMASALTTFGTKNPRLADLTAQMQDLDQQTNEALRRIVTRTELDVQLAKNTEIGIRNAYLAEQKEAYKMNDAQIHLAILQQDADSTRNLYQDLYTKLGESKLSQGTHRSNIAVISAALEPANPSSPNLFLNGAIGLGAGLMLGICSAFIRDSFDDSVETSNEVEALTGVAVLGSIPLFEAVSTTAALGAANRGQQGRTQSQLPAVRSNHYLWLTQKSSQASEAYRSLRTSILLSHAGSPPRSLLMTSSLPFEGKTTTTYNLAACFALTGSRVLAVDADLRRPSLHRYAGLANPSGLSNLLTSSADPDEVIRQDPNIENLSLLFSGPTPPNPSELLLSSAFGDLIKKLEGRYDLVIVDSPPCMVVADASIMAGSVDGVMIVVRSSFTRRPAMLKSAEQIGRSNANLLGFIVNAVDTKSATYYYSHGYYGQSYYKRDKA
jgi:capsular exopolysaccharide synthesis family protein